MGNRPEITQELLANALRSLDRSKPFTTADVIRVIDGAFVSDKGAAPSASWNAAVGSRLSEWEFELGITKVKHAGAKDDLGHRTSVQHWNWRSPS